MGPRNASTPGARARIALDVGTLRAEPTGVGVYVRELGQALRELDGDGIAFLGVRPGSAFDSAGLDSAGLDTDPPRSRLDGGRYLPWLLRHADRDADSLGAALVHYTSAVAPVRTRVPYVVTIYDLSMIRDPLHHPPLRLTRILLVALAAHRARVVIVPSHATARDVTRGLGVPRRRIAVVPLAAPPRPAEQVTGQAGGPDIDDLLARHGVTRGGYVLSTGGLDARKNPVRLADAMSRLRGPASGLRLVIVGPRGFRATTLEARIRSIDTGSRVVLAGYVADTELEALRRHAAVFAFVSLHEGFGLPILEAMAVGVPVVTSRLSSMPEVAGGDAVLVDPRDPGDIARGIERAVARRGQLVQAGIARVAARTWRDVAGETLEVYRFGMRHAR